MTITSCLVDTNILLRMTRRSDPQHKLVDAALVQLAGQSTILHYTHQNIAELWNAMTRPLDRNGLGLTAADAEREVRAIETGMVFCLIVTRFIENGGKSSFNTASWGFRFTMRGWRLRCMSTA